jgi:surfeit locus 1 family protein
MAHPSGPTTRRARGFVRSILVAVSLLACAGFVALGNWQIERRAWKLELIETTQARLAQPPTPLPPAAQWPTFDAARESYRRVRFTGRWLIDRDTYVQATTVHGPGFWLLRPLALVDETVVIVNRGFVRSRQTMADEPTAGGGDEPVTVEGLLRPSEPGGGFPRRNVPAEDRWFSRDIPAIVRARGLDSARVAPYFVDAGADPEAPLREPIGGLTIVTFRNHHLSYALTWYGLALLAALAAVLFAIEGSGLAHRQRRASPTP